MNIKSAERLQRIAKNNNKYRADGTRKGGLMTQMFDGLIKGTVGIPKHILTGKGAKYSSEGMRRSGGLAGVVDDIASKIDPREVIQTNVNIGEAIDRGVGTFFNSITHKVKPYEAKNMIGSLTGRELNASVAIGGAILFGAASVGDTTFKMHNKLNRGDSLGVVSIAGVTTDPKRYTEQELQDLKEDDGLTANVRRHTINNYGATGDIVFALNNMR